jgi:predicted amidohydrolase YtcJ
MTVLDVDPLTCTVEELEAARVLMTVIDGEVVYEAAAK